LLDAAGRAPPSVITVVEEGAEGVVVVALFGAHDVSTSPALDERLTLAQTTGRGLVADLSAAAFVDSSVIGTLLGAQRRAQLHGSGFAIALGRDGGFVRSVLEITRLLDTLPTFETRAEAIAAASGLPSAPL
jgi:anti-sigma B factor antagonist